MAKFMVKASEFKNVCKAVNDRKLAELKKEIIEILKKQDEKDFKKATDYLNSQEEHFTHLEKSFSGKWIEKAGYGIGTVRVWKGKKYKKIAPDKWVRVFDKEGRGTNIAIGKLIAKVNKIDNVEDLMAFVMANKQRFVDENGVDLPVLDKLRAAVDARNNGGMESSKPAEKKNTFKQEMNQLYDAQDEAWEGFESGSDIKSSPENSKKFYERVKKFVDNNNIKLSQKHYDELEEMNGHSFNEALELTGAYGEEKKEKALAKNREYSKKYKGQILDLSMIDEFKEKDDMENPYEMTEAEKKEAMKDPKTRLSQKYDLVINTKKGTPENDKAIEDYLNERDEVKRELGIDAVKNFPIVPKAEEKKNNFKKNSDIEIMDSKQSQEEVKEILDNYDCSREFAEYVVEQNEAENREPIDMAKADELREYSIKKFMSNFKTPKEAIDYAKKYDEKMVENGGAGFDWKIEEYCEENNIDINKESEEEKPAENGTDKELKNEAIDKVKKYAGKKINSNEIEITKIEDDGKRSGFLTFEFKSGNDTYKMTYDYGFGGEKVGASIKKIETEENKTYWIQDSRGNRLTNEDAKKRIQSNLSKIIELESGDEPRKDMKIRDLKLDNEYLKERLNLDDRKEFVSKVKKSLFDGFLGLELLEEGVKDEEKDKEEESLWNDYSAEQPELFNSTAMKVREALDRINNQVL